jgi:hypothetical protein
MSNDFKKVSVIDDRLNTTDSLNYAVFRGGQNVNNVRMPAISATNSALNFVIPFPSESTVLDREVYLNTHTDYYLQFESALPGRTQFDTLGTAESAPLGSQCPLIYGYNISLGAFPTQRSLDTIQVQINNNIMTINTSDVLPALLRCADVLDWEKENMCASSVDRLASPWNEVNNGINSNMSSYDMVQGNKNIGNGSFNAELYAIVDGAVPTWYSSGTIPNYLSGNNQYTNAGTRNFILRVRSVEPLVAPPFIWNKTISNRMGIYGIQNISIVGNYGNLGKSVKLSFVQGSATVSGNNSGLVLAGVTASGVTPPAINQLQIPSQAYASALFPVLSNLSQNVLSAELQLKYVTPHGTDVKPLRNVIPLLEFPRFITSGLSALALATSPEVAANPQKWVAGASVQGLLTPVVSTLSSQTYTFNQVPDKLIIFVRPNSAYRSSPYWNDFVLAIRNITIQWNNHAGILSNATQEQLFHMSKEAGSNQDWISFKGYGNFMNDRFNSQVSSSFLPPPIINEPPTPFSASFQLGQTFPQATQVHTTGSYLMLDMAKHLELVEPFYAPGSLGSFQLQFNVQVENYTWMTPPGFTASPELTPEIVVIPVNSGIMVTERGQSSSYTGILTKADVLDAALQEPYSQMNIKRIIGHGHGDSSKALPKNIVPMGKAKSSIGMAEPSRMEGRLKK